MFVSSARAAPADRADTNMSMDSKTQQCASILALAVALMVASSGKAAPARGAPSKPEAPVARVKAAEGKAVWKRPPYSLTVRPDLERKSYLPQQHLFVVEGVNSGTQPATISATLILHSKIDRGKAPKPAHCLIYLEIPAGETRNLALTCAAEGSVARWELVIQKIWDFVL